MASLEPLESFSGRKIVFGLCITVLFLTGVALIVLGFIGANAISLAIGTFALAVVAALMRG